MTDQSVLTSGVRVYDAYEVFMLHGGGYHKRKVLEWFWHKNRADEWASKYNADNGHRWGGAKVSKIHVVNIDGKWRRILVGNVNLPPKPQREKQENHDNTSQAPIERSSTSCIVP